MFSNLQFYIKDFRPQIRAYSKNNNTQVKLTIIIGWWLEKAMKRLIAISLFRIKLSYWANRQHTLRRFRENVFNPANISRVTIMKLCQFDKSIF